ncbi:heavy metal translocating P-type ATPase [Gallaecimonas xiamenensis]|uniref:Heavy metal translocating P-type ATPase n=1 Tax=Gallaecimonas xiamenensis 3-C-1 TaxID=745411 RepID=K2K1T7_9GAMM|nr:heavy metal translocating P-type ATPase [Gallaecimonas xiamenensis]EKE76799.1 heavy metal translocating P-type ATPase [Gallaecimonas xiamenensis 3-C-1]
MSPDNLCYHCHQPLDPGSTFRTRILGKDRALCCAGCQAVSQAIVDSGLSDYYRYRTQAAVAPDALVPQALAGYDSPALQRQFVHQDGELSEVILSVDNLSCAACAWLIEKRLGAMNGVARVHVNATSQRLQVRWQQDRLPLSALLKALADLGYPALPFAPDQQEALYSAQLKRLTLRLGLAGIATMQVMMFAFAFYFGVGNDGELGQYFRYLSWGLASPVALYSAQPFYQAAWRQLRLGQPGMDVPVSIAILGAYLASSYATFGGGGEVYFESIAMFTFLLLTGRLLELRARHKAAQGAANLLKLVPALAWQVTDQGPCQVPVAQLALGDRVQVRPGEKVPTDLRLTSSGAELDESFLTGEALPVAKKCGDSLYAGSLNLRSPLEGEVKALGADNLVAGILRLQEGAQAQKPKSAQLADLIARRFVVRLLLVALLTYLGWLWWRPEDAFWVTLSVLVASCPCALSLATPAALTCTMSRLGQLGWLVRQGDSLEVLPHIDTVLFDKTGTLTQGRLELADIKAMRGEAGHWAAVAAALEAGSEHPIARAFDPYAATLKADGIENHPGQGVSGTLAGVSYRLGSAAFTQSPDLGASLYLADQQGPLAGFWLKDRLRDDAPDLIARLKARGLEVALLTGDGSPLADQLGQSLGIKVSKGLLPADKLAHIRALQQGGHKVLVVGDGVNDAPVLAGADLSLAMGSGTDLARASSDVVLLGDQLGKLDSAWQLVLKGRRIIRQNYGWALCYNLVIVPVAVLGLVSPWLAALGMSLSSLLVLSNSLRLLK